MSVDAAETPVVTREEQNRQLTDGVSSELEKVLGTKPETAPDTSETPLDPGSSVGEFLDRGLIGRPGVEPSKSFREKLKERLGKMNSGK